MPTENRRIATYLPKEVDEKFQAFKLERGIKGDSHALLTVLSEFLGVAELVAPSMPNQYQELSRQFNDLQTELISLETRLFSRLKSELLSELPKALLLVTPGLAILPSQLGDREVEIESDGLTCLTGKQLAERFGFKRSDTVNRWKPGKDKAKSSEKLLADTQKQDPDGIGWSYLPEIDKFQSEKPLPVKSPSVSQGELPSLFSSDPAEDF